jgi:glycosyltransferase involved in cell wall biosynthesis
MNAIAALRRPLEDSLVSVVLPLYNEAAVLDRLHRLVSEALDPCGCRHEIVFVNDGSTDGSDEILDQLAAEDPHARVLHLSRNFGHQAAVQAGLTHARGDAVIVMDSDLQDDPRSLPALVSAWQAGYDVVYAVRYGRKENFVKRALSCAFYRLLNLVSKTPLPEDAGNFGLIDRRVVDCILQMPEADRYFSGLRGWVGFRQTGVPVERLARHDEQPRVSFLGLVRLAKTALFSFSTVPLGMFYAIAAVSLFVCLLFCSYTLFFKLFTDKAVLGWTSTVIVGSFFGALNALGIGVLGEYVVRIYDQVRGRPKFIVARETKTEVWEEPAYLPVGATEDASTH